MLRYFLKQFLGMIPLLFLVSVAAFFVIRLMPGDPATAYLNSIDAPLTEERIEEVRESMGLDKPVPVQYGKWLGEVLNGELGNSYQTNRPVLSELKHDLGYTAGLAFSALVWIILFSAVLGILSARHARHLTDTLIRGVTFLGSAMPKFWLGFLLVFVFSLKLNLLPVQGAGDFKNLILPSFTLACAYIATYTKLLRNSILETRGKDFVTFARVRGFSRREVTLRHVLPNALIPVLTTLGLHLGGLLSGTVIVENVFSWPGLGRMCVEAVEARDYPMLQGYILLMALIFVAVNLLSDMVCAVINPKIRLGVEQ